MEHDGLQLSSRERTILHSVFRRYADRIDRVAVFGSRALGRAKSASDIDVVLYGSLDDATVARIWSLLDQSSLAVTADLVRYESLGNVPFRYHIDRYAKPLFEKGDLSNA